MGKIPVLSENQMSNFRRIVGENQRFKLTDPAAGKASQKPTYIERRIPADFEITLMPVNNAYQLHVTAGTAELEGRMTTVAAANLQFAKTNKKQFDSKTGIGYFCLTWDGGTAGFEIVSHPAIYDYNGEFALRVNEYGTISIMSTAEPDIAGRAMLNGVYTDVGAQSLLPENGFLCLTWNGENAGFEIVGQEQVKQPRTLIELED